MMPPISASLQNSSSAKGGEFGVTNTLMQQGDWIVTTGAGKASGGLSDTGMYVMAAAVGLFCIMKWKKMI
uniref:Uncharacterized protein n=1 Tax=Corticoviridae sp. TaxID=2832474 RepID=A0A8D9PE45_9VIRU|nr:MAG TPA: hypothetical protein [Corticoviridae sp.]